MPLTQAKLGRTADALASIRRPAATYGPLGEVLVAQGLAVAGEHDEARALMARCEAARADRNVWLVAMAMAYAQLGDVGRALDRLEEAYEVRDFWIIWLKVQPEFDPLRGEARFQRLLRKVHLA